MLNAIFASAQIDSEENIESNNVVGIDNYINVSLYPNPSKGYFNIEMEKDEPYNVVIYAMNGNLVYNQENIQDIRARLDLTSTLSKGLYHVRLTQGNNAIVKKLIIQ